jgi:Tfp pilus assembly protein PilF
MITRSLQFSYSVYFAVFIGCLLAMASCQRESSSPEPGSETYQQAVADFYMSLGASQTDQARFAFNKMNDVARAYPDEPAAWANLGVFALRQGNFDLAAERLGQSRELAPDHPDILFLSAIVESRHGELSRSVGFLRDAAETGQAGPRILYALAMELEREDDTANADEIRARLEELHERLPQNQIVLLELARVAAKEGDHQTARMYTDRLREHRSGWNDEALQQLELVDEVLDEQNMTELTLELSFLRTALESLPRVQADLLAVQLPPADIGFLIPEFLHLPKPEVSVAEPDLEMTMEQQPMELTEDRSVWVKGVTLLEEAPPFPVSVHEGELVIDPQVRLAFPGSTDVPLPPQAVTEIDYNYNFLNDLALAGSEGFRLYRQNDDQTFTDVTEELRLSPGAISGNYRGVWPFDVDMDGDLDMLLAPADGSPFVLRNNGDGTFTEVNSFSEMDEIADFRWADLDGDGIPEAVFLLMNGDLVVYRNLTGGQFAEPETIAGERAAIVIADLDANTQFDIISVDSDGRFYQNYFSYVTGEWSETELQGGQALSLEPGAVNLFSADLDNNGALDLILSTPDQTAVWLGDADRNPVLWRDDLPGGIVSVFDVDGNERLDLLGVDENLTPFQLKNSGTRNYFARSIRARASGTEGDHRINSFGIGGEMEVRSGLLYQKQLISSPIVHFGLGEYDEAQMLRIVWPNGSVQAEFAELGMGATIFNEQILKGSCPWLFTGDGEQIHFITDILWRSPLGLRINALETAGVVQTLDRVKIPADKINAVDGEYDVRITAELWETHFFDYVSLVAVDHPEDTEIFVDERFVFPAPDLSTRLTGLPEPVLRVTDEEGSDLTDVVSEMDGSYIKPFRKTAYQGLVEEHSIEIELNQTTDPQWLLLSGWLRPTDSSLNLALSQGSIDPPQGLQVEVSDGNGGWKLLHENYGIPAGKLKTVLIDLEDVFPDESDPKVRLTTTSEIYWDAIFQADKMDDSRITETALERTHAELRYRGFSDWYRPDEISPKLADYHEISSTTQRWRDLEGFHTRFGDVGELLDEIDDRYVIMNAGDELLLRFGATNEPEEGYTRSYVFVSDGWEKDGDYNTEASRTVIPLPYHGQADYEYQASGTLFDDPVFQRHREDWVNFHTRYITPHQFRTALKFE